MIQPLKLVAFPKLATEEAVGSGGGGVSPALGQVIGSSGNAILSSSGVAPLGQASSLSNTMMTSNGVTGGDKSSKGKVSVGGGVTGTIFSKSKPTALHKKAP